MKGLSPVQDAGSPDSLFRPSCNQMTHKMSEGMDVPESICPSSKILSRENNVQGECSSWCQSEIECYACIVCAY
jgi:hypothetical protein